MGSKTSEDHESQGGGHQSDSQKPFSIGGMPRGTHTSTDGDGSLGDNGSGADDDDDDASSDAAGHSLTNHETVDSSNVAAADKPKKRKKPNKKKKKKSKTLKQTSPPRVKLSDLFPSGDYPKGEFQDYNARSVSANSDQNLRRVTDAEKRHDERHSTRDDNFLSDYRKGAEVHRQVRRWVQETAKPGMTLTEIAVGIEDGVRALLGHDGLEPGDSLKGGMGFPTGLALNNCVAHYTPNPGQKDIVLQHQDVMKVDFGVHVNGWIVDSAFTMSFDPTYDDLLTAVKEATNAGIRAAGADVRICDVSASIQEVMESYEVEIRGKTFPVKPVRGISAHDIKRYHIHGGKSIPFLKNSDQTKMEEGEIFAIETFGTTGRARLRDGDGVYGYGLEYDGPADFPLASAKRLYKTIKENFGTLVFCRRYLDRLGLEKYLVGMNYLVSNGFVESYPPLMDIPGSYSAQFEHTILLGETGKEVVSRGDDY